MEIFKNRRLKREELKSYCNSAWPLYKWGGGGWGIEKKGRKRVSKLRYYLAIGFLPSQDGKMDRGSLCSSLHGSLPYAAPVFKSEELKNTPNIFDDPLLTFPNFQGGNQISPVFPEPPSSLEAPIPSDPSDQSHTPPPYVPLWSLLSLWEKS